MVTHSVRAKLRGNPPLMEAENTHGLQVGSKAERVALIYILGLTWASLGSPRLGMQPDSPT